MIPLVPRKPLAGRQKNKSGVLPSSTSHRSSDCGKPEGSNTEWRSYGITRRRQLLEQDAADGGNRFDLNYQCRIQGYFALAEKVKPMQYLSSSVPASSHYMLFLPLFHSMQIIQIISKFNASFAKGSDIESTYVMGNRLSHFLTEALPRHPAYMKKDPLVAMLREKSFQSLVHIKKKMDSLALRIDEEQLNQYIMNDFDPFADEDHESTSSSDEADNTSFSLDNSLLAAYDPQWENFNGWSFYMPDKMTKLATDKVEFDRELSSLAWKDLNESAETEDTSNETFSLSEHSFQASDDNEPIYDSYGLDFLKRIASEAVRYESDSDAADSWAQECNSEVESALYSNYSLGDTCDPARIALRELMNSRRLRPSSNSRLAKGAFPCDVIHDDENRSLSFDLSLDVSQDGEEDIWIAFDPTKKLDRCPAELERISL
jgi:hypothetical protein